MIRGRVRSPRRFELTFSLGDRTMNPMLPSRNAEGFTCPEVLGIVVLIVVLAGYFLPAILTALRRDRHPQVLSNMRQLHLATQTLELDGTTTDDSKRTWPGDYDGTFTNWGRQLVPEYLTTNDFCKLLSAPGVVVPLGKLPTLMDETALRVYAVSSNSPANTVFLTSANFTNTPTGGAPLQKSAKPYGARGFAVFRKGGDGAVLLPKQVGNTNVIGGYVPLLR